MLWFAQIETMLTAEEEERWGQFLSGFRRQELERPMSLTRRQERLQIYALEAGLAWRVTGIPPWRQRWKREKTGRPICLDQSSGGYSLAHTRGAVFLGMLDQPLGVDIEPADRAISALVIRRCYQSGEQQEIAASQAAGPRQAVRIWTRKEANAKRDGRGLVRELLYADTAALPLCWMEEERDGYMMTVCTKQPVSERMETIEPRERLALLKKGIYP